MDLFKKPRKFSLFTGLSFLLFSFCKEDQLQPVMPAALSYRA